MRKYRVARSNPSSGELKHYGITGQKWGVRRYENEDGTLTPAGKERYSKGQNENYREDQRKRDRVVYGKGGERRINRSMNEGYNISGARSKEAQRINKARTRANTAATVGAVGGVITGFFAPEIIKAGAKFLGAKGVAQDVMGAVVSGMSNPKIRIATSIGAAFVAPRLGSKIGSSVTMRLHGYSGSKYDGATGIGVANDLSGALG